MEISETTRTSLQQPEWVTSVDFKDAYFHIPIQEQSRKSHPRSDIPVQGSAIRFVHSAHEVHCNGKRGETDGHTQGYKDPPIPRQLVGESQVRPSLSPAYTGSSKNVSGIGLAGEFRKIRTGPQTSLRHHRLQVRPQVRSSPTDTGLGAEPSTKDTDSAIPTGLSGQTIHVFDRSVNSHRKASLPRPTTYETHTVASLKQLESTGITGKNYSNVERGSRQASQARPDHPDRMVSPSRGFPINMQQGAPASSRSICHEVQQQVTSVCVTRTRFLSLSSECTRSAMGGSGRIYLPTNSHLGQNGGEVEGLPVQENYSNSTRAQHALVLESSCHVQPNPTEPAQSAQPFYVS